MKWLLDTNAIIYIQKGLVNEVFPDVVVSLSVISRMELFSFAKLSENDRATLDRFLQSFRIIPLILEVEKKAIELRLKYGLKLLDTIIAASASVTDSTLITNDQRMAQITEIKVKSLKLK